MMFSNDETLALSVGLRVARDLGLSDMTPAVASAQAKLDRVMPKTLKRKIGDLNARQSPIKRVRYSGVESVLRCRNVVVAGESRLIEPVITKAGFIDQLGSDR